MHFISSPGYGLEAFEEGRLGFWGIELVNAVLAGCNSFRVKASKRCAVIGDLCCCFSAE